MIRLLRRYKLWKFDRKYSDPNMVLFRYEVLPNGLTHYDGLTQYELEMLNQAILDGKTVRETNDMIIARRRSKI